MTVIDHHLRLEPDPGKDQPARGFAATVHDPVWFLARQWMMGEFQAENASTPVRVDYAVTHTPLQPLDEAPDRDPRVAPAESLIEDEPDSWWTIGRRLRIGAAAAGELGAAAVTDGEYLFTDPPPPYEQFAGAPDGLALWRKPPPGLPEKFFDSFGVPPARRSCWNAAELVFSSQFATGEAPSASLLLPRHRGGRVDWFSADADGADFSGKPLLGHAYPSALQYPGAPVSRWWEIEDAAVDIGGYPPDTSHFATTLLIELICSHSDDWFLFPIDVPVGTVNTIAAPVTVTDSFSRQHTVSAPEDWWMFRTSSASPSSLVTWLRALTPIEGPPIEDVLLGLDEYSNRLWAIEQRVDGKEAAPDRPGIDDSLTAPPDVVTTASKRYGYVAGTEPTPRTHAYDMDTVMIDGHPRRRFVQRRIADVSRVEPALTPAPTAELLRVRTPGGGEVVHEIEPATIPSIGTHVQRRYKLARDTLGRPCLWVERQRNPVLRPPSRALQFDQFVARG